MATQKRKPAGRKPKYGVTMTKKVEVRFTDEQFEEVMKKAGKRDLGDYGREKILLDTAHDEKDPAQKVPLLGFIPASPAITVVPIHGAFVDVPAHRPDVKPDYALIVTGHSMECEDVVSIPDGAYAYFSSVGGGMMPRPRDVVHVEFIDDSSSENEVTLAIYKPQPDGSVIFDKCNELFEPILRKKGEPFEIRGIFVMSYKESAEG